MACFKVDSDLFTADTNLYTADQTCAINFIAQVGTFNFIAQNAFLIKNLRFNCINGIFVLTGEEIALKRNYTFFSTFTEFDLTGINVTFTINTISEILVGVSDFKIEIDLVSNMDIELGLTSEMNPTLDLESELI